MATPGTLPMDGKSSGRKLVTTPAEARAAGDPAHNRQQVGAHGLDAIKDILFGSIADRHQRDYRSHADDNSQHGQHGSHSQNTLGLSQHDEDLRRHLNLQLTIRIGNIEQHVVEHNVVDEFRSGKNLSHLAAPAPGLAQDSEIDVLAEFDAGNIGFRDLRPDCHGTQVGNSQDIRCLLIRVKCLPFQSVNGNYFACHGSRDFRVPQVGFCGVHRCRCFLNLC